MKIRTIYAAGLLALLALACVGAAAAAWPGPPGAQGQPAAPLESFRAAPGSAPTPNQSYLAKQMQTRMAACIASVVNELSNRARVSPRAWQVPDNVLWEPIGWRIGHQHFDYRPQPGTDHNLGPYASVTFTNARWDPTYSEINVRHQADRAGRQAQSDQGKTKVIQNDSATPS